MKASGFLLICFAVYTATGLPLNEDLEQNDYAQFIKIENVNGVVFSVDLEEESNMPIDDDIARNPTSNEYQLYTRQNPTVEQKLVLNDLASINSSNFNPARPTIVIAHGWLLNTVPTMVNNLRDSFLHKEDVNVISLDWRFVAIQDYVAAAASTPTVGRALGTFLAYLNRVTGAPFETMHLVGFNLGAHAVGNAGRELEGRVARITGLDPSGPLWTMNPLRLSEEDARYVEVIHTDGGVSGLGIGVPSGVVDFFPNGGISQPGCLTSFCDHNRAWQFFDASIRYDHLIGSHCANVAQISLNTCRGSRLNLGNTSLFKPATGMYRVNTGRFFPF